MTVITSISVALRGYPFPDKGIGQPFPFNDELLQFVPFNDVEAVFFEPVNLINEVVGSVLPNA